MSTQSTIQVQWTTVGDGANEVGIETVTFGSSAAQKLIISLVTGSNQISLPGPPTMNGVLILPPVGSSNPKTWNAGLMAVGGPISPGSFSFIGLPTGTTSFWLGSGGNETIVIYVF